MFIKKRHLLSFCIKKTSFVILLLLGQQSIYGDVNCHGVSADGKPYLTASEGFEVEEIGQVF